jgi:ABC-type cobalt transport system substrate-binding protein
MKNLVSALISFFNKRKGYFTHTLKYQSAFSLPLILLIGCTTPQEIAIIEYCRNEALKTFPIVIEERIVIRNVNVGERTTGHKHKCSTSTSAQDHKSNSTTRTTECVYEPIVQPIYENRQFIESVDINFGQRGNHLRICISHAKQKNMFSDLKK